MRIEDVVPPAVGLELLDAVAGAAGLVAPDADEAGGGIDAAEDLSGAALGSAWRWLVDADAGVEVRVGSGDEAGGEVSSSLPRLLLPRRPLPGRRRAASWTAASMSSTPRNLR